MPISRTSPLVITMIGSLITIICGALWVSIQKSIEHGVKIEQQAAINTAQQDWLKNQSQRIGDMKDRLVKAETQMEVLMRRVR